jgi:hypothetical protein
MKTTQWQKVHQLRKLILHDTEYRSGPVADEYSEG